VAGAVARRRVGRRAERGIVDAAEGGVAEQPRPARSVHHRRRWTWTLIHKPGRPERFQMSIEGLASPLTIIN